MPSRRQFLQRSALLSFAPTIPAFLPRLASTAGADQDAPILVVIHMDGGNDGLNTLVPFADDAYARHRKTLRLDAKTLLKVDDHIGLHPSLRAAHEMIDDGRLAIVQGAGYANSSRSHFQSNATWQTAKFPAAHDREHGWIGTAFDHAGGSRTGGPDAIYVGKDELPLALSGRRMAAASLSRADDLVLRGPLPPNPLYPREEENDLLAFVRRSLLEASGTATTLAEASRSDSGNAATYPDTLLASRLQLIAKLIKAGGGTRVYYATQPGYDTHGAQRMQHAALLREFSGGLKAFLDDLKAEGLSERVLVLGFSEFGRRVAENASGGTDHGAAGPVFLAGDGVQTGVHGEPPRLDDLEEGALKVTVDFRRIYSTLLEGWLKVPAKAALGGDFDPLPLLRG